MQIEQTTELIAVITDSGVEKQTAQVIEESFLPFFNQAKEWKQKASGLVVTDVSQTREMKMAREARLALKEIRVNADKTRKALKEDSLRYGRAVQGVYNVIEYLIKPIEDYLQEQENFVQIQEAKRKAELANARQIEIEPFAEFIPFGIDFGNMSDEDYKKLLNGAKLQLQQKLEAEAKAEAERIAREKAIKLHEERKSQIIPLWNFASLETQTADLSTYSDGDFNSLMANLKKAKAEHEAEQERIRKAKEEVEKKLQEERAKSEAERKAAEEKARKEREEAAKKLEEERQQRAKIEAEMKAKAESERKAAEEAQKIEAEKAKAPDREKLKEWASRIASTKPIEVSSPEAQKVVDSAMVLFGKLVNYINENADKL